MPTMAGQIFSRCNPVWMSAGSSEVIDLDDNEREEVEPGEMRVSEIKSELSIRGIIFEECFDKESLVKKLEEARVYGKADPSLSDEFNSIELEAQAKEDDGENLVANDGNLSGGMSPEDLQKLMANPEIMTLLQSQKMQEAMNLMMTGGREDLEKAMASDPEIRKVVLQINTFMRGAL